MYRYPSFNEAKAQAKHIAKTFNNKPTEAQEIVAYTYNCRDWAELKRKQNTILDCDKHSHSPAFDSLISETERQEFDALVSLHIDAIKTHINPKIHFAGSLLDRVATKSYGKISGLIIKCVLEDSKELNPISGSKLIDLLEFYDDTFSRILCRYKNSSKNTINTHITQSCYRQGFYAYYTFNNSSKLYVLSREWDLDIYIPSDRQVKNSPSICTRKWFVQYMVRYLQLLVQQFRMAGYVGKIRICKVNNASVLNFYNKKTDIFSHEGINNLFQALLKLGGTYVWETDEQGRKYDFGIEILFEINSVKWMVGGFSL